MTRYTMNFPAKSWRGDLVAGIVLGAVWGGSAHAQTPPSEPAKGLTEMSLEELMDVRVSPFNVSSNLDNGYRASNSVSGSRFDAPTRDLPFAIQAFTQAFIEDQKPVNIFDVARYAPGVTYRSNDFNEGNANLAIRGFAISSTPGNIQSLRDGFHGPSIFDFTNIERVEVVKGPASFLYGQVAPGGIVNVITKSPQPQFAATAKLRVGSYGEYRVEPDITGPIEPGLYYRVAASYDQDMHYWDPYDAHSLDISPSLLAQPTDWLSMSLKYEHFTKIESPQVMQKPGRNSQAGAIPSATDPNLSGVDVPGLPDNWNSMANGDFRRSTTNGLSSWLDLRANDHWDLRVGYAYQDYTTDMLFSGNLSMADNSTFLQGRRLRRQIYRNRGSTVESQAVGKYRFGDVSMRLLLGAQYVRRTFDAVAGQAPNDPALGTTPTASPLPLWDLRDPSTWNRGVNIPLSTLTASRAHKTSAANDRAVYAGTTFGFFDDRLLALAGCRQTWTDNQLTDSEAGTSDAITSSQITPQFGLLYKVTPGISVFSTYAESFVPGSQILLVRNVPTVPAAPTKGEGVDVGAKFDLLGGRLSGTVSYFDIRNKNIVNDLATLDPVSGSILITNVQSGEQRSRGIELDTTVSPIESWQLYLSYSYMDARIVEFSGNDRAILAQNPDTLDAAERANYKNVRRFHNAPLQMSAPHLANVWSRYDFTRSTLAGLYFALGANLVIDQTLLPDTPQFAYQSYALLNGTVGYSWGRAQRMTLDLTGKNLANEQYRPSQSSRSRPREFLLSWTIKL
ncbi:MAG: TonB-dependent receptor [Pseudomonadota bacterium]